LIGAITLHQTGVTAVPHLHYTVGYQILGFFSPG
jgi:hypothetical protein